MGKRHQASGKKIPRIKLIVYLITGKLEKFYLLASLFRTKAVSSFIIALILTHDLKGVKSLNFTLLLVQDWFVDASHIIPL